MATRLATRFGQPFAGINLLPHHRRKEGALSRASPVLRKLRHPPAVGFELLDGVARSLRT